MKGGGRVDDLVKLAELVKAKNRIDDAIARHIGESIASRVFGSRLEESATQKRIDRRFVGGPRAGCTVDIRGEAFALKFVGCCQRQGANASPLRQYGEDVGLILPGGP